MPLKSKIAKKFIFPTSIFSMEVFKRLLLPISSEFFSENVAERAEKFVELFGSKVYAVYIIEEKTLRKVDEIAEPFLTEKQRKEMEKNIIEKNKGVANIIFEKIAEYIPDFEREIIVGEFSDVIMKKAKKHNATCVMMGFEKECFLRYRLLENIKIPVWVEIGKGENVLGVCSNLAPNVRVPKFTLKFAEKFGKKAYFIYVIDTEEKIEVDEKGVKREKTMEELRQAAEKFAAKYKKYADVKIAVGSIEGEVAKYADEVNADVVIIGREMKKRKIFSREIKKEMIEKIKHSLLFLN